MIGLAAFLIILVAVLGAPLFIVFAGAALLGLFSAGIQAPAFVIEVYRMTSAPALLAIPLFIFAGTVFANSGTPRRLVSLSNAFLGWVPGGLALVAVGACAFFTAFTGASGVTIVALGGLLLPALLRQSYPERFSLGLLTTSGSIGLLFPPSLPVILYGLVAKADVGKLFLAGVVPGIILVSTTALYSGYTGYVKNVPRSPVSWRSVSRAVRDSAWEIPLPFLIIGGIYGGFITAMEAAAVTATYAVVVEVFVYRDIHWRRDLPRVMVESAVLVGAILIILSAALGLTNYLIDQEVPMRILGWMRGFISQKILFLILLNCFLIVVGCMMDIFSAIMVVVPLIVPIAMEFGVDPFHLGMIFLVNLEIGYSTPPVGINLFLSSMRFEKSIGTLYRSVLPFLALRFLALGLVTYIPFLSLCLLK